MKKYTTILIPIITLAIGAMIGYLVWGNSTEHKHSTTEVVETSGSSASPAEEVWTCSMHPQIRQGEAGICPICEMDLIPLDNDLSSDDPTVLRMSVEAAKLAQIETFKVGGSSASSDISKESSSQLKDNAIKVDGTAELDERTIKSQTAHLSGRIEKMGVTFAGQYVKKGARIATIYSTELLAASQELLTAAQYNDRVAGLKDAAIQKLRNWKITDDQIEKILSSGNPIETIPIYADYSGYVLDKKFTQGDYIKQGQAIYTIGSTSRLWLLFNVFENDLANVKIGDKVKFSTPSVLNNDFEAKVTYIDPLLNKSSRTATIRAEISNSRNELKPGMLLNGFIYTSNSMAKRSDKKSFSVPSTAVLWTGDRSVVYVQVPDREVPSFEFREVEIGRRSGEYTTIISGLDAGDAIVSEGAFSVDAAAQLSNNFSMMNRNVKVKKDKSSDIIISYIDNTSAVFKDQLDDAVIAYIDLKDELVNTDNTQASSAAKTFIKSLKEIDMSLLKGDAHVYWMEQLNALNAHADKISNSQEIEEQRDQFSFLSQALINSLKAFGTSENSYYVQYCPMAKDNQGADWIAKESEIRNPYFGDKMMKCGSVKLALN